ncbi:uncharacterized protein cenpt isoform X2 [Narcine bancroftii]|uniref:uncharacterized protein cenpt isoform X2 n=1 Tax=Narcine bancroftii TaxID=1343680 RepID=UPI003831DFC5
MMDYLREDVTLRTLMKGVIAEEIPKSIVRPWKQRSRKSTGNSKLLTDVAMQQSPQMILRSQMKTKVRSQKQMAATTQLSAEYRHSTRKNSSGSRKSKHLETVPQKNLNDYTPRKLLKKFIQTERESSLVKVSSSEMKKSVEKESQPKTALSDSDMFSLSLPANDTEEQNLPIRHQISNKRKVSVSQFEKAVQERVNYTTEPQEGEQSELCEKSTRPPDISTIVGLINPDFEETTTKPILCRRPVKRKVINEDEFEEGVHNYLAHNKVLPQEPEQTERCEAFEKTTGLTDISEIVGSINVGTDESVSKPVLSRRPKLKFINEDDFEGGVLFYLQKTKEAQVAASKDAGKKKSITNAQQNKLGVSEHHASTQQAPGDGVEIVPARTEEIGNNFGLNAGLELEKPIDFTASGKEKSIKTPNAGRDSTHHLVEQKNLVDTDALMERGAEKFTGDPRGGNKPMDHELEFPQDTEQNLSLQVRHEPTTMSFSDGILVDVVDDKVLGVEVNDGRTEGGETVGILVGTGGMEKGGVKAEGPEVDDGSMEAGNSESIKVAEAICKRKDSVEMKGMDSLKLVIDGGTRLGIDRASGAGMDGDGTAGLGTGEVGADGVCGAGLVISDVGSGGMGDAVLDSKDAGGAGMDPAGLDGAGMGGTGTVSARTVGDRVGSAGLDGAGKDSAGTVGDGVGGAGLDSKDAGSSGMGGAGLDSTGMSSSGTVGNGAAGGETDNEIMEETEEIESNEMDEEMMHSMEYEEDDSQVVQPFQQSKKVLKSSPLLATPHFLKTLNRQAQKPMTKARKNPKKPIQKGKKTILPSGIIKSVFTHYAKMRVKREAFETIDQCLEVYFKQLCDDMDVYSKHAKRKTIEKEDVELLMRSSNNAGMRLSFAPTLGQDGLVFHQPLLH